MKWRQKEKQCWTYVEMNALTSSKHAWGVWWRFFSFSYFFFASTEVYIHRKRWWKLYVCFWRNVLWEMKKKKKMKTFECRKQIFLQLIFKWCCTHLMQDCIRLWFDYMWKKMRTTAKYYNKIERKNLIQRFLNMKCWCISLNLF